MIEVLGWAAALYGAIGVVSAAWMLFCKGDSKDVGVKSTERRVCLSTTSERGTGQDSTGGPRKSCSVCDRGTSKRSDHSVRIHGRNVLSLPEMKILDIRRKALADQSMFNDRTEARIHSVASIMHKDIRCERTCDAIDDFLCDPFLDPGEALDRLRASFSEIEA